MGSYGARQQDELASDPCISSDVLPFATAEHLLQLRDKLKSLPDGFTSKKQKKKQRDPKSIHEMPVDRGRISRACAPQFASTVRRFRVVAQQQIT